jgi:hypothetical protein
MKKLVSYFRIVLNLHKITIGQLINQANGIRVTTDTDVTAPSYNDAALQAQGVVVQGIIGDRVTDPKPLLTHAEQIEVNKLSRMIVAVSGDVEKVANDVAQGDRDKFEVIVRRTGFLPKGEAHRHQRVFETVPSERGTFHGRVPGEGDHVVYVFEYGITSAIDVAPPRWEPQIPIPTTDIIVSGLPSGSIVGLRYAAVLPPKGKGSHGVVNAPEYATSKALNQPSISDTGKIVHSHGSSFLHFSDTIYFVIQ